MGKKRRGNTGIRERKTGGGGKKKKERSIECCRGEKKIRRGQTEDYRKTNNKKGRRTHNKKNE